jgi:hypothetical protein
MRRGLSWVFGLALLVLSGCTVVDGPATEAAVAGGIGWTGDVTVFQDEAETDLERRILEDGVVTEEERVAAEDEFVACAARAGFTVTDLKSGGRFTIDGPFTEDGPPPLMACQRSFDRVSGLFWAMKRNPAGTDEAELMTACLIRAGVVDPSFTRDEYLQALGTPPLAVSASEFSRCNAAPTTAFTE